MLPVQCGWNILFWNLFSRPEVLQPHDPKQPRVTHSRALWGLGTSMRLVGVLGVWVLFGGGGGGAGALWAAGCGRVGCGVCGAGAEGAGAAGGLAGAEPCCALSG